MSFTMFLHLKSDPRWFALRFVALSFKKSRPFPMQIVFLLQKTK